MNTFPPFDFMIYPIASLAICWNPYNKNYECLLNFIDAY